MRSREQIALRWVRGNDVLLRVTLQEPKCDSNGYAMKDSKGNPIWQLVDLDSYSELKAAVKMRNTDDAYGSTINNCSSNKETDTAYEVTANRSTQNGILLVEIPSTLPNGDYALEITGKKEDKSMRTFEPSLFSIVECNKRANVTFDIQEGVRSTDLDIKIQMVASGVARGKNAYELWRELPGNEDKRLQEYLANIATGGVDDFLKKTDIADWAKESVKPTYTAGEVGALPVSTAIPTRLSDLQDDTSHRTVTDAEKTQWNSTSTLKTLGTYNESTYQTLFGNGNIQFKTVNGASIFGSGDVTVTNPVVAGEVTLAEINTLMQANYTTKSEFEAAIQSIADDDNVVHKTGSETIRGNKTFVNEILFETYTPGEVEEISDGEEEQAIEVIDGIYNTTIVSGERVYHVGHDDFSWIATNEMETTEDADHITLQSVLDSKATDENLVHRTGIEEIRGIKTFYDISCNSRIDYTPSSVSAGMLNDSIHFTTNPTVGACMEGWGEGFHWIRTFSSADDNEMMSVQDALDAKQDKLVSGVHLKTINGQSLVIDESSTDTNIVISGGGNTPAAIDDTNLVHKSSAETITGTKTFNNIKGTSTGFTWVKDSNNASLEARLSTIESRLEGLINNIYTLSQNISSIESRLRSYTFDSSTGTLTFT